MSSLKEHNGTCIDCKRKFRPLHSEAVLYPGQPTHHGRGRCGACWSRNKRGTATATVKTLRQPKAPLVMNPQSAVLPQHRGPIARSLAFDEDLEFLLSWGTAHVEIRTRLNVYSFRALEKRLERHQRTDLLPKLTVVPAASRVMSTPSKLQLLRAENDRLFRNLMTRARFEADRARRGIPPAGAAAAHIIRTTRSIPISKAA